MRPNVIAALACVAAAMPAFADDAPYYDEQAGAWSNSAPPPPPAGGDYGDAQVNPDVSVDLPAAGPTVSFETFHDGLAPYGEWITVGGYGRVWRPARVAAGWRPYYYGRWEWTDEGWLWVSDEPWGWAAYHYGRWAYDPYHQWVWIPGYQWAPAWVTWRYSPEYIGWAPLGPGFSVYVTTYPAVYGWWTFVPCHRFVGVPIYSVAYTGAHVRGIFHATQPAPPRAAVYGARAPAWGGPARPFVEQRVGRPIVPVRIQPVASPGLAGTAHARPGVVPIYRPEARPLAPARPVSPPSAWGRPVPPSGASAFTHGSAAPGATVPAPPPARLPPAQTPGSGAARPAPVYGAPAVPGGGRPPQGTYAPGAHPARPAQGNSSAPPAQAPAPGRAVAPAPAPGRALVPAPAPGRAPASAPAPGRAPAPAPAPLRPQGSNAPRSVAPHGPRMEAPAMPRGQAPSAAPRAQGGYVAPRLQSSPSFARPPAPVAPAHGGGRPALARGHH